MYPVMYTLYLARYTLYLVMYTLYLVRYTLACGTCPIALVWLPVIADFWGNFFDLYFISLTFERKSKVLEAFLDMSLAR